MPWYNLWAICIVLEAPKPNLLDAVCCRVEVVNGPRGFLVYILDVTSEILYFDFFIISAALSISLLFLKENFSISEGLPPEINLNNEKNNGETVLQLIRKNLVTSAHDISSGGLLVALSEMSIGSNLGAKIYKPKKLTNKFSKKNISSSKNSVNKENSSKGTTNKNSRFFKKKRKVFGKISNFKGKKK